MTNNRFKSAYLPCLAIVALALALWSAPNPASASTGDAIDLTVAVVDPGTSISLPLLGTYTGVTINWGDGASSAGSGTGKTHTYTSPGAYQIRVSAPATGALGFGVTSPFAVAYGWQGSELVTEVTEWNNLTTLQGAFSGAYQLTSVPNYLPSTVTNISWMFNKAAAFNQDISGWNTSNITTLYNTFYNAESFNQPIGRWNISNVTSLSGTFGYALAFNQDISTWNTSRVTDLQSTFAGAAAFNQPLASWDVRQVTTLGNTFLGATSFNQPLNAWNTSNVTAMAYTFYNATSFNQSISSWNVSRVTDMSNMFYGATAYNQPLTGWTPTSTLTADYMFQGASSFNQSLGALPFKSLYPVSIGRMLNGSSISAPMLSDTLQGWAHGWTVGGVNYAIPNAVTTTWHLKYVSDAATTAAVATLTTTNRWNLTSETASYLVSFGAGAGAGTPPAQMAVGLGSGFTLPSSSGLSKAGYDFAGWSNGSTSYAAGAAYPAGSSVVAFTAMWTASALQVTVDGQNGAPATTITSHTDEQISAAPSTPTRIGYLFNGWFTASAGGTAIAFPYTHNRTANFTLYAQWTALPQTVTYRLGAGTGATPTQGDVLSDGTFTLAAATGFARVGYSFVGWNDGTTTYAAGTSYRLGNAAVMLSAQWTANPIAVSLNPQGGSSVAGITTHTDEQIAAAPEQPVRAGYQFMGWFTGSSGGTAITFPYTHNQTAIFTLYAQWAPLPNQVRYSIGSASGVAPTQSPVLTGESFTVAAPVGVALAGYAFDGWNDSSARVFHPGDAYQATGSAVTLTAIWRFIPVTKISFDANGGSGELPKPIVLASGGTLTLAGSMGLEKPGYQLAGWNEGAQFIAVDEAFKVGFEDFTLVAVWQKVAESAGVEAGKNVDGQQPASPTDVTLSLQKLPRAITFINGSKLPDSNGAAVISRILDVLKNISGVRTLTGSAQFILGSTDALAPRQVGTKLADARISYLSGLFAKFGVGLRMPNKPLITQSNKRVTQLLLTLKPSTSTT